LFTIEYVLRLISVRRPLRFATSFYGVVDLAAVLPTYLGLLVPASHYLLVVRALRLLRVFRILKLAEFLREAQQLQGALRASGRKIEPRSVDARVQTRVHGVGSFLVDS
jgi:voltage-gated potassium channel